MKAPRGPLSGVRIVELGGLGPVPHACMQLCDLGADVLAIQRPVVEGGVSDQRVEFSRGKSLLSIDLKDSESRDRIVELIKRADVVVEGFRPGVAERLALGPEDCRRHQPRLIYARLSGWGRGGDLASSAGHDINFLAMSGVLDGIRRDGLRPHAPGNLLADMAAGSQVLSMGVLAALYERERSGVGQVVDASMLHGLGVLSHLLWSATTRERDPRDYTLDLFTGRCPFYRAYRCADGKYVAVGATEDVFFERMIMTVGVSQRWCEWRWDKSRWPELEEILEAVFAGRDRDAWTDAFADIDACVTPVLTTGEVPGFSQAAGAGMFIRIREDLEPVPVPEFSSSTLSTPVAGRSLEIGDVDDLWAGEAAIPGGWS